MTEIRPIRTGEDEEFLELLCHSFGLELDRARSVFYAEPMFDMNRKWALLEGGSISSILTTVPLEFGWGRGLGIAGVATREERRGQVLASQLLDRVVSAGVEVGETAAYLFAKQPSLYGRNGFEIVDRVIRGPVLRSEELFVPPSWEFAQVQERYREWAEADDARLRRDERRWQYWQWNMRVCTSLGDGYVCTEGGMVREAVCSLPVSEPWMLPPSMEWVGLESVTDALEVPLESRVHELYLMARGAPGIPQMFMTDQF